MTTAAAPSLLSLEAALRLVLEHAQPLGVEACHLSACVGRVPAEDLRATVMLPPFDNSAMDGYALHSRATTGATPARPVILPLVGESAAGAPFARPLQPHEAIKIMTGAPLPSGANSVVMLEEARLRQGQVQVLAPVAPGRHVRRAGEDVQPGQVVVPRGRQIQWPELGLLAGLGCARVNVFRAPQVAVLATGSELVAVEAPLAPGQIRNSNSLLLTSLLRQLRLPHYDYGAVADEPEALEARLRQALTADVVLISGGVSVGEHDLVKRVLKSLGFEQIFWRVNMKPGKPALFGRVGARYVFGLPGNPVSCVAGFLAFIAPFLRKMLGDAAPEPPRVPARLTQEVRKSDDKLHLVTARTQQEGQELTVTPTSTQGSGMLTSLAQANGLLLFPEAVRSLSAGTMVEVWPL